jgi:hypothetical protein
MSQPVKLSDALVLDARIAGKAQERSIAGQVEFWAKLGRSMELLLEGRQVMALCGNAGALPLSEALASVDTLAGRKRVAEVLANRSYPHFKQHPHQSGLLIRTDEDGKQTVGRFVNRMFTTVKAGASLPGQPAPQARLRTTKKSLQTKPVSIRIKEKSMPQRKEREAWA